MDCYDVLWIENDFIYHESILYSLKSKRIALDYSVIPWHYESFNQFMENTKDELSCLYMQLALVDFDLGAGMNGDAVIAEIRKHKANDQMPIVFYSGEKNIEELERLTKEYDNIYYSQKGTLQSDVERILSKIKT